MRAAKIAYWLGAAWSMAVYALFTIPTHEDMSSPAHLSYPHSGMPAQAATFVTGKL